MTLYIRCIQIVSLRKFDITVFYSLSLVDVWCAWQLVTPCRISFLSVCLLCFCSVRFVIAIDQVLGGFLVMVWGLAFLKVFAWQEGSWAADFKCRSISEPISSIYSNQHS